MSTLQIMLPGPVERRTWKTLLFIDLIHFFSSSKARHDQISTPRAAEQPAAQ